jgi:hypothetical protein
MAKKKKDPHYVKNPVGTIIAEHLKIGWKQVQIAQRQRQNRALRQAKAGKATYSRHSAGMAESVATSMNKPPKRKK